MVVIILLGILGVTALGRFQDLSGESQKAVVAGTGAALQSGVTLIHYKWLVGGTSGAVANHIGDLNVGTTGWPVESRGSSLTTGSNADCLDVWQGSMSAYPSISEVFDGAEYLARYRGSGDCEYLYQDVLTYTTTAPSLELWWLTIDRYE